MIGCGPRPTAPRARVFTSATFELGVWTRVLFAVPIATELAASIWLVWGESAGSWWWLLLMQVTVFIPGAVFLTAVIIRPFQKRHAAWREKAWVASLPFAAPGYLEVLSKVGEIRALALWVHFAGAAPAVEHVRGMFEYLATGAESVETVIQLHPKEATVLCVRSKDLSDAHLASWFRGAATAVLVKLHGSYPIASVDIEPTFVDPS